MPRAEIGHRAMAWKSIRMSTLGPLVIHEPQKSPAINIVCGWETRGSSWAPQLIGNMNTHSSLTLPPNHWIGKVPNKISGAILPVIHHLPSLENHRCPHRSRAPSECPNARRRGACPWPLPRAWSSGSPRRSLGDRPTVKPFYWWPVTAQQMGLPSGNVWQS